MNTTSDTPETLFIDFNKWLSTTVFSVAISFLLTLLVSFLFSLYLSTPFPFVFLWLPTSVFSFRSQVRAINATFQVQLSRWLPLLLISSLVGWAISLLLAYSLARIPGFSIDSTGEAIWIGFFGGGVIGLFPGIFTGLAYCWLMRPYSKAMYLLVINTISWCLGIGLVFAGVLLLLAILMGNMFTVL